MTLTREERFWDKVVIQAEGCWEWIAARTSSGYGSFYVDRTLTVAAHRFAYELSVGAIPEGLFLDHLCRNRACVNPDHLEPVTNAENTRRGLAPILNRERAAQVTHCPKGHEYSPENTRIDPGHRGFKRVCRACEKARRKPMTDEQRERHNARIRARKAAERAAQA